jgi:hypothetical protein
MRTTRSRLIAWGAIAALALPLLAQVAHRMPGAGAAVLWDAASLCLSGGQLPGSEPTPGEAPDGATPRCPVCLTLHAAASFLPVALDVELRAPRQDAPQLPATARRAPARPALLRAEPRAPPLA